MGCASFRMQAGAVVRARLEPKLRSGLSGHPS
jgi:hypothetical protein